MILFSRSTSEYRARLTDKFVMIKRKGQGSRGLSKSTCPVVPTDVVRVSLVSGAPERGPGTRKSEIHSSEETRSRTELEGPDGSLKIVSPSKSGSFFRCGHPPRCNCEDFRVDWKKGLDDCFVEDSNDRDRFTKRKSRFLLDPSPDYSGAVSAYVHGIRKGVITKKMNLHSPWSICEQGPILSVVNSGTPGPLTHSLPPPPGTSPKHRAALAHAHALARQQVLQKAKSRLCAPSYAFGLCGRQ